MPQSSLFEILGVIATSLLLATSAAAKPQRAIPVKFTYVGKPHALMGNVATGLSDIVRLKKRDTVLIYYTDSFEGEPTHSQFWLLDAPSGKIIERHAWDYQFLPDNKTIVYSTDQAMSKEDPPVTVHTPASIAKKLRLSVSEIERAKVVDGFIGHSRLVRPVVLNIRTGKERRLPCVGGGMLALHKGKLIGLPLPSHWEFPSWEEREPYPAKQLHLNKDCWKPLKKAEQKGANEALLKHSDKHYDALGAKKGTVLVTTRDRSLGLVVVDATHTKVQAAHLPKHWKGQPMFKAP